VRIESISVRLPSKCVSNDDLLEEIRAVNAKADAEELERYCRHIRLLLLQAGSRTRFYRNKQTGETAISLIVEAADRALRAAVQRGRTALRPPFGLCAGLLLETPLAPEIDERFLSVSPIADRNR